MIFTVAARDNWNHIKWLYHRSYIEQNKNQPANSDFYSLTKYLDVKKYKYYTYKLKDEKDISAVIRNLPMSITELEVIEELNNFKFPIKSDTRITNKTPILLISIQLSNNPRAQNIFKLNKLLKCIITVEPRQNPKILPNV